MAIPCITPCARARSSALSVAVATNLLAVSSRRRCAIWSGTFRSTSSFLR